MIAVWVLAVGWAATGSAQAEREVAADTTHEVVTPTDPELAIPVTPPAHEIFQAIATAWSTEDHSALAALVDEDGVEIAMPAVPGRDNHYSSDQAFYFFKTLFQSAGTDSLRFRRLQGETTEGVVHGVADWEFLPASVAAPAIERLIFTIAQDSTGWGLTEIRAIR